MQKVQDWLTQQWVILRGRKIHPSEYSWLVGPFGNPEAIGEDFIRQLAEREKLTMEREAKTRGLIPSMDILNLSESERSGLARPVVDFYEHTADYDLYFSVKWNPVFRVFGVLIRRLFSNRLRQLNIPTKNSGGPQELKSELITLADPDDQRPGYTFWVRSIRSTGERIYSGVYGTSALPSGKACIKAVFPLPNGNATVLMTPGVGPEGALVLDASGQQFGDAGFYFLLKDAKGEYWAQYIKSFRDRLTVRSGEDGLSAEQVITLGHREVLRFHYKIEKKG
jgi:hypothetical protein